MQKIILFLFIFSFYKGISQHTSKKVRGNQSEKKIILQTLDTLHIIHSFSNKKVLSHKKNSYYFILNSKSVFLKDIKQVYIHYDESSQQVFEILTKNGPQYYNFNLEEIPFFKESDVLGCGNVYKESVTLNYNKKNNRYLIEIRTGNFGSFQKEYFLTLKNIPKKTIKVNFLNNRKYASKSINNKHKPYINLLKIQVDNKIGIYSYNKEKAWYPKKKKAKQKYLVTTKGDTLWTPVPPVISFVKKGFVTLKEVLPPVFDSIKQSSFDGKVYLFRDHKIGIFPHHKNAEYTKLQKYSKSFYKVFRGKDEKWLDIKSFQEYKIE